MNTIKVKDRVILGLWGGVFFLLMTLVNIYNASNAGAVTPSIESLFRNAYNTSTSGTIATVKFKIRLLTHELQEDNSSSSGIDDKNEVLPPTSNYYISTTFIGNSGNNNSIFQQIYSEENFSDNTILRSLYLSNFPEKIIDADTIRSSNVVPSSGALSVSGFNYSQSFFYIIINNLLFNRTDLISALLKKYNNDYLSNSQLLNRDKIELIKAYREYLSITKKNPALKDVYRSPLDGADLKTRKELQQLWNQNTFVNSKKVKLTKIEDSFFWEITLQNARIYFTNTDHQLYKVIFNKQNETDMTTKSTCQFIAKAAVVVKKEHENGEACTFTDENFEFVFNDFLPVREGGLFPGKIYIKMPGNKVFLLTLISIEFSGLNSDQYLNKFVSKKSWEILKKPISGITQKLHKDLPFIYVEQ